MSGRFPDGEQHEQSHGETRERGDDEHPPPAQRLCVEDKAETKGHAVAEIDAPVVETKCSTTELLQVGGKKGGTPLIYRTPVGVVRCPVKKNCYRGEKRCPQYRGEFASIGKKRCLY